MQRAPSPFVLARILDLLEVLLPEVANDLVIVSMVHKGVFLRGGAEKSQPTFPHEKHRIGIIIVTVVSDRVLNHVQLSKACNKVLRESREQRGVVGRISDSTDVFPGPATTTIGANYTLPVLILSTAASTRPPKKKVARHHWRAAAKISEATCCTLPISAP